MIDEDSDMKNHFVACTCERSAHTLRFSYIETDEKDRELGYNFDEIIVSTYLNPERGFFSRCKDAFKYIFCLGEPCFGHFCITDLNKDSIIELIDFLNQFIENKNSSSNTPTMSRAGPGNCDTVIGPCG